MPFGQPSCSPSLSAPVSCSTASSPPAKRRADCRRTPALPPNPSPPFQRWPEPIALLLAPERLAKCHWPKPRPLWSHSAAICAAFISTNHSSKLSGTSIALILPHFLPGAIPSTIGNSARASSIRFFHDGAKAIPPRRCSSPINCPNPASEKTPSLPSFRAGGNLTQPPLQIGWPNCPGATSVPPPLRPSSASWPTTTRVPPSTTL